MMTVAVVLALIAFVAPSSAYSIDNGIVVPDSPTTGQTTWTFNVKCDVNDPHDISHFVVAWCNEGAVESVTINPDYLKEWEYGTFTYKKPPYYEITGIKVELEKNPPEDISVVIILNGIFGTSGNVDYLIKAGGIRTRGEVYGPLACNPIPEFSTIAIPVATILGLLFFFNRRKQRKE